MLDSFSSCADAPLDASFDAALDDRDDLPRADGADDGGSADGAVRPDEMSSELCAFLARIDAHKRSAGKAHLRACDVRDVLLALGYRREGKKLDVATFEREYASLLGAYKARTKRLFPTWSEIYGQLRELGWRREAA